MIAAKLIVQRTTMHGLSAKKETSMEHISNRHHNRIEKEEQKSLQLFQALQK